MFTGLAAPSRAYLFYAIALVLALCVAVSAPWLGEVSPLVTMLTPALAAIIMLAFIAPEGGIRSALATLGLDGSGWKAWPFAFVVPVVVLGAVYGVVWMTDIASVKPPDASANAVKFAVNVLAGLIAGTVLALCEEVGWRGYMLPKLLGSGAVFAALIVGFLHGVWHLPLMLFTPYYHAAGNPYVTVPLFLLTLTLAGIVYAYVRLVSGSVWPAAILHGMFNWSWSMLDDMTEVHSAEWFAYVGGESGVATIAALVILDAIVLSRLWALP